MNSVPRFDRIHGACCCRVGRLPGRGSDGPADIGSRWPRRTSGAQRLAESGATCGAGVGGAVIGNEIRKGVAGLSSSKQVQQFTSNVKSAIENVVSKASSPEQVTNSTIQLVSQGFPQEDRTAVRMFMQYLTGTAPENAGDLVPEADQEDAWKHRWREYFSKSQ